MILSTSKVSPGAAWTWVTSACQHWLGSSAVNRTQELLGRLCGCGVTNPRALSTRQIVETDGGRWCRRARWAAMVAAPASNPAPASCLRSATISSSHRPAIRVGE